MVPDASQVFVVDSTMALCRVVLQGVVDTYP
jgi:hypothetical protein